MSIEGKYTEQDIEALSRTGTFRVYLDGADEWVMASSSFDEARAYATRAFRQGSGVRGIKVAEVQYHGPKWADRVFLLKEGVDSRGE